MASVLPCMTKDLGDAAFILGDTDWVVPHIGLKPLDSMIIKVTHEKQPNHQTWLDRKHACYNCIVDSFSIQRMIQRYHQIWFK